MTLGVRKLKLMGVAAVALLAMSASGCSSLPSVPDWVDPTTWFGSDEPADNGQTPDLAGLPDKPVAPTPDEQQKVAESLAGDRSHAKYSADALRGGSEPAANPPADTAPAAQEQEEKIAAPKTKAPAQPVAAPTQVASVDRSVTKDPEGATSAGTLPAPEAGVPTAVAQATPAPVAQTPVAQAPVAPAPVAQAAEPAVKTADLAEPVQPVKKVKKAKKPVQVAQTAPEAEAAPAPEAAPPPPPKRVKAPVRVAAAPAAPVAAAPVSSLPPGDAELGFKPSSAPPLDPSVSQFVAAPIVNHYRSTAAASGTTGVAAAAPRHHKAPDVAMGGPATMEGKVVANLDSIGAAPATAPVVANPNGAAAVVFFPNDTVGLTAEGKAQIRSAVAQFKASGGQGYIRVVGHSSSRTPNMSAAKHVEIIFKKSQDRANAVARELIRAGIPADHVLVEAVGDTEPVYYESMPKGEDGNRRAEIFLQG